ncbi:MAG: macro domain-containing protein [Pseudomonadota bacterium]
MIHYTQGNLFDSEAEVIVNTVNTVGVMGKGIALMFKELYPQNMQEYAKACKAKEVKTGKMFITQTNELLGPHWVVNFPTKQHWRNPSKMEWITSGLDDLKHFIKEKNIKSIAIPPLGAGNGKLKWDDVRVEIEKSLSDLPHVDIFIYEPSKKYQNIAKQTGTKKLTPARAMIAELIRCYWVLGMECSLLEIQKLAWFLERSIKLQAPDNPLDLRFKANLYGPYADRLRHLLENLDGYYLKCDKRISDAEPLDIIWFNDKHKKTLHAYLKSDAMKPYLNALKLTSELIDGFESPFGMELLSTIDWLLVNEGIKANVSGVKKGLLNWPAGKNSAQRKAQLFDDRAISIALERLSMHSMFFAKTPLEISSCA